MIAPYYVCYLQMILCYSTLPQNGLQLALDRFSDACSVAGMKISATKTETMCLSRQPKKRSLQIDGVPLQQSEKFKYLASYSRVMAGKIANWISALVKQVL